MNIAQMNKTTPVVKVTRQRMGSGSGPGCAARTPLAATAQAEGEAALCTFTSAGFSSGGHIASLTAVAVTRQPEL
eukprot:5571620-Amphidinium_carterae.1